MLIYLITNTINGKQYVGQTTRTLEDRISWHHNSMVSGQSTYLYNAMRKYGWDNFRFEILATADTKAELDKLEKYYISKFDTYKSGYNMTLGGDSNPMDSPIVADKHHRRMQSEETRSKISKSMIESIKARGGVSAEHRKHLSEQKKQFYASEAGKRVKEQFSRTYKVSPEHRAAINAKIQKSVYCIDIDGNVVAEFSKVKDAAKWLYDVWGYHIKHWEDHSNTIKQSAVQNRYIRGLKWIYRV